MDAMANRLKDYIDQHGPDALTKDPMGAYETLLCPDTTDRKTAAALYHTFLMDIPTILSDHEEHTLEEISKAIQKECFFRKTAADQLAEIYLDLYSKENQQAWDGKQLAGLKEFMEQEWEFCWEGEAQWNHSGGYVNCTYDATICIRVIVDTIHEPMLEDELQSNPFLSSDDTLSGRRGIDYIRSGKTLRI